MLYITQVNIEQKPPINLLKDHQIFFSYICIVHFGVNNIAVTNIVYPICL